MSIVSQIYLTAAITGFIFFGLMLFSIHLWVNLPEKSPRQGPANLLPIVGLLVVLLTIAGVIASAMVAQVAHT